MAIRIWKDILRPGTVKAQGRIHVFDSSDIQQGFYNGKRLIDNGYQIPIYWEHQRGGPVKLSEADKAKNTIGRITNFRINSVGVLEAEHEFDSEEDVKRLPTVKFVSPEIDYDWSDAEMNLTNQATITHVAVTPRPVQKDQTPFQLSEGSKYKRVFWLSESDYEGKNMADAKDDDKNGSDTPKDWFPEAIKHLKNMGIPLLDDTTPENVWERICVAANAVSNGTSGDDKKEGGAKPEETKQTQPIAMSLQKQLDRATNLARKDLANRIEALNKSGRITPQIGEKLTKAVTTVQLSFGDDGELNANNALTQIEAYEALPEGSLFKPTGRVKLGLGKPELEDDSDSPEKTDQTMKDWDATK